MRKKLTCKNCDQVFWAYPPSDSFSDVTLEYCELPDYDFVVNHECENCKSLIGLFWHNRELEKKRLLEIKEMAYLRERYLSYGISRMEGHQFLSSQSIRG